MNVHIETERLLIRELRKTDLNGMFDLDSDPEVHKYLGNKPIQTKDQAMEVIDYIRKQYDQHGIGRLAVIDRKTEDFIGWGGLKYEQKLRKEFSYYDLGYRIRKKYWGKGIATEIGAASIKYGFTTLKLKEICAAADVDNLASNRILKKIGLDFIETFEFEGTLCNWYKIERTKWSNQNNVHVK